MCGAEQHENAVQKEKVEKCVVIIAYEQAVRKTLRFAVCVVMTARHGRVEPKRAVGDDQVMQKDLGHEIIPEATRPVGGGGANGEPRKGRVAWRPVQGSKLPGLDLREDWRFQRLSVELPPVK